MDSRYIIVELFDHLPGGSSANNCATLTKIILYDKYGEIVPYTATEMYDTHAGGATMYWDAAIWGKSNLNNDNFNYISNKTGQTSSTFFYGPTVPNSGHTARFVLDLWGMKSIDKIDLWAGSPEYRIPRHVKFFGASTYDFDQHIKTRSDDGLILLATQSFDGTENTVRKFELDLPKFGLFLLEDEEGIKYYNNGWNPVP